MCSESDISDSVCDGYILN